MKPPFFITYFYNHVLDPTTRPGVYRDLVSCLFSYFTKKSYYCLSDSGGAPDLARVSGDVFFRDSEFSCP